MPVCTDRTTKVLGQQGYNLVRYPRPNIMPLDVLAGVKSPLEWLGPLPVVWTGSTSIPQFAVGAVPQFQVERTDEFKGSLGIRILQGLLGSGPAGGRAEVAISSTLSFTYESPKQLTVSPFIIGEYLRDGDLNANNMAIKRYLAIDNALETHFYLITEVLRAKKLLVRVSGSDSEAVKADVSALQGLADGKAEVSNVRKGLTQVAFDGDVDVTFAFRAYELGYVDGQWILIGAADKEKYLGSGGAKVFGTAPVSIS